MPSLALRPVSVCANGSKSRPSSSGAMPVPRCLAPRSARRRAPTTRASRARPRPRSVNFTALPSRLSKHLARPLPSSLEHRGRHPGPALDLQRESLAPRTHADHLLDRVDRSREREGRLVQHQLAGLDLRDRQDVVDEPEQVLTALDDDVHALLRLAPERPVARQELREAEDRVERRAKLVAHRRQERRLGAVGARELEGALLDLTLELDVAVLHGTHAPAHGRAHAERRDGCVQGEGPPGEPGCGAHAERDLERPLHAPAEIARPRAHRVVAAAERRQLAVAVGAPGAGLRVEADDLRAVRRLPGAEEREQRRVEGHGRLVVGERVAVGDRPAGSGERAAGQPQLRFGRVHLARRIEHGSARDGAHPDASARVGRQRAPVVLVGGQAVLGVERLDEQVGVLVAARAQPGDARDALVGRQVDAAAGVARDLVDGTVRDGRRRRRSEHVPARSGRVEIEPRGAAALGAGPKLAVTVGAGGDGDGRHAVGEHRARRAVEGGPLAALTARDAPALGGDEERALALGTGSLDGGERQVEGRPLGTAHALPAVDRVVQQAAVGVRHPQLGATVGSDGLADAPHRAAAVDRLHARAVPAKQPLVLRADVERPLAVRLDVLPEREHRLGVEALRRAERVPAAALVARQTAVTRADDPRAPRRRRGPR